MKASDPSPVACLSHINVIKVGGVAMLKNTTMTLPETSIARVKA